MPLTPAITDLEPLKEHPAVARLRSWNPAAVEGAKFDRDEMTIYIERSSIRDACVILRDDPTCPFNYLSDVTCVDWYPSQPRFEVVYQLLSIPEEGTGAAEGTFGQRQLRLWNRSPRFGRRRITSSARFSTCSASGSPGILIYGAFKCRKTGKAIRCAKTIRWRAIARRHLWPT